MSFGASAFHDVNVKEYISEICMEGGTDNRDIHLANTPFDIIFDLQKDHIERIEQA